MPSKSRENTYGVFLSSSSYLPGVLALSQSLNNVNSVHPLTVFMTSSSPELLDDINNHGLRYIEVSPLQPPEAIREKNISAGFSRWNGTFAKLRVLEQIQFNKIVMLDADMMVNRNIDFIFDSPHMSAVAAGAKAHPGWEDLNSGFMVLEPSIAVFNQAMEILEDIGASHLEDFTALGDQDIFQRLMPTGSHQRICNFLSHSTHSKTVCRLTRGAAILHSRMHMSSTLSANLSRGISGLEAGCQ